jgi:hypothetical protein
LHLSLPSYPLGWPLWRPRALLSGSLLFLSWHSLGPATHYGWHPTLLSWHLLGPSTFKAGSYDGPHFSQQTFPCLAHFTNQKPTIQSNPIQSNPTSDTRCHRLVTGHLLLLPTITTLILHNLQVSKCLSTLLYLHILVAELQPPIMGILPYVSIHDTSCPQQIPSLMAPVWSVSRVNHCWPLPSQSFLVTGPNGTHNQTYVHSKTIYTF